MNCEDQASPALHRNEPAALPEPRHDGVDNDKQRVNNNWRISKVGHAFSLSYSDSQAGKPDVLIVSAVLSRTRHHTLAVDKVICWFYSVSEQCNDGFVVCFQAVRKKLNGTFIMKLADALLLRSDMNKKIASLSERIKANCRVQDGDEPGEDPQKLLSTSFRLLQEMEILICRINRTNVGCKLPSGKSMMESIAERDRLNAQHRILKEATAASRIESAQYSNREIKWKSVLKVDSLEKQADDLSKKIRELNSSIQEANWINELVD